jgi:ATP dependent DNA ligase domain
VSAWPPTGQALSSPACPRPPTSPRPAPIGLIKHDGYRMMARRDSAGIRLLTRNGNDWSDRFPLIVEAVNHLKIRSCLIDGEAVCCDERAWPSSSRCASAGKSTAPSSTHSICWSWTARTCGGSRSRSAILRRGRPGVRLNEHLTEPGDLVFRARLQDGPGGDRFEAAGIALPIWAFSRLAEVQEPGDTGSQARGGGGLELIETAIIIGAAIVCVLALGLLLTLKR